MTQILAEPDVTVTEHPDRLVFRSPLLAGLTLEQVGQVQAATQKAWDAVITRRSPR